MTVRIFVRFINPALDTANFLVHDDALDDLAKVEADVAAWPHNPENRFAVVRADRVHGTQGYPVRARDIAETYRV